MSGQGQRYARRYSGADHLSWSGVAQLERPEGLASESGLLITNPPYGERLGSCQSWSAFTRPWVKKPKRCSPAGRWLCSLVIRILATG
ncbi:hypothetical protein [Vreelandella azerica]|uniref:hypothetical protein n=1 Tax=Vreelandella azerica TaxID=2732867 RepID=UPI003BF520B3